MLTAENIVDITEFEMSLREVRSRGGARLSKKEVMRENFRELMAVSDADLRIRNANDVNRCVDPVDGTTATDPVYRKISKAAVYAHDPQYGNPYWGVAGIIQERVINLQTAMEERTMDESTYRHLLRTSMKNLLAEWDVEIRADLAIV